MRNRPKDSPFRRKQAQKRSCPGVHAVYCTSEEYAPPGLQQNLILSGIRSHDNLASLVRIEDRGRE